MRILVTLILVILLCGGVWILSYEKRFVPLAPCGSGLKGKFIFEKNCEAYWESTGNIPSSSHPSTKSEKLIQRQQ